MSAKKIVLLVVMAVVLLGITASPAFALHSGYDATTGSCRSCHAVHNATGDHLYNTTASRGAAAGSLYAGQKVTLNSASVAQNLCEWCHVYGTSHAVYQSGKTRAEIQAGGTKFLMGMHALGATTQPDKGSATFDINANIAGLDCIDCHNAMPHAAKATPGIEFYVQDADVNAMCVRCHEANDSATHAKTTHPLVADADINAAYKPSNYAAQAVAFAGTPDCLACHTGGVHSRVATIVPNGAYKLLSDNATVDPANVTTNTISANSTGYKFTNFSMAWTRGWGAPVAGADGAVLTGSLKVQDTQCLSCHRDATGTNGVGLTY